jgi:hypothetical protein
MTANQTPNEEFLDVLHERILWQDYLVIDGKGVSTVSNILKRYSEKSRQGEIQSNEDLLRISSNDSNISLEKQVQVWNTVCQEIARFTNLGEIDNLLQQISPNIRTNLNWDEFIQQWTIENQENIHLGCEFPTLVLNNP